MFKRIQKSQNRKKPQKFLQHIMNNKFEMVLVEQWPEPCTKPSHDKIYLPGNEMRSPSMEFNPIATSTPKKINLSAEEVIEEANTKLGPRLTMSQFLGEIPSSSKELNPIETFQQHCKEPPERISIELKNFISQPQKAVETVVVEDFTNDDSCQAENHLIPAIPYISPRRQLIDDPIFIEEPREQAQKTKYPILGSYGDEKDLQSLFKILEQRTKNINPSSGSAQFNDVKGQDSSTLVEFWKNEDDFLQLIDFFDKTE